MSNLAGDEFLLLKDDTINEDDRKEILEVIDKVAAANRLTVTPGLFALKPARNGLIFPLIINAIAIVAVVAGFFVANLYFGKKQSDISSQAGTFFSAEGKLLAEVRRQSQAELQAKDQQIQSIQGQLTKLDQEASNLRQNMQSTISAKEQELKSQMQTQLEAEKARLAKLGVSQEEVNRRLAAYQDQMNQQFNQQIAAFQKQAQDQLTAKEQEIRAEQDKQRQILEQANQERQQLESEAQAREAQMRTQFENEQAALQSQNVQLQNQASQAQALANEAQTQLQSLAAQSQTEQLIADQIVGSYNSIIQDLNSDKLDQATKDMDSLRQLLSNPKIDSLPDIAKRRPVDLALLSSIQQLIKAKSQVSQTIDPAVQRAAGELAAGQALVAQGDAAASKGELKAAEDYYTRALAAVPSLNKAFTALKSSEGEATKQLLAQRDALIAQRDASLAGLQKQLADKNRESDALNRNVASAQATIADLRRQIGAQQQQIAQLNQSISTAGAQVTDLQNQIAAQRDRSASLEQQLAAANGNVGDLKRQLADNESKLADLQKQIEAANAKLAYYTYGPQELKTAEQRTRDQTLNDILLVTNYFTGQNQNPSVAHQIDQLSQSDPLFKNAAAGIQSLAVSGTGVAPVLNTQFKLIGPVTFASGDSVTVEKLVDTPVATGALVMIKHKDGSGTEVPIAEGPVSLAASDRIQVTIKTRLAEGTEPQSPDLAYLEVSGGN